MSSPTQNVWRSHLSIEPLDARLLIEWMSRISEQQYCAGWHTDTEFALWSMLEGGSRDWGIGDVPERDLEDLRILSQRAGGWIVWDGSREKDYDGKRLVSFDEWRMLFAAHEAARHSPTPKQKLNLFGVDAA